jgi:hypothetical protein
MITSLNNVFADPNTDGANRTFLPPRSFLFRRKASVARNDEKTIPIIHVDVVHRIPKRYEDRRSHRVEGIENATARKKTFQDPAPRRRLAPLMAQQSSEPRVLRHQRYIVRYPRLSFLHRVTRGRRPADKSNLIGVRKEQAGPADDLTNGTRTPLRLVLHRKITKARQSCAVLSRGHY